MSRLESNSQPSACGANVLIDYAIAAALLLRVENHGIEEIICIYMYNLSFLKSFSLVALIKAGRRTSWNVHFQYMKIDCRSMAVTDLSVVTIPY